MILEACGVGRRVAATGQWLLKDVDLHVAGGERTAVVGPSGSGKTVLLRSLALLDPIQAGEIHWQGKTITATETPRFRSRVIYLHQRPALAEGNVEDCLRQPLAWHAHAGRSFEQKRVQDWLAGLGRDLSFLAKLTRDLSGGEAQIVAILRAIQLAPDILLLDEPTAALDEQAAAAVEVLVEKWLNEAPDSRATVWVSHNASQASRVASRILTMQHGRIRKDD